MLDALIAALPTTRLASHWYGGETPARHGSEHSVVAPYQAFRTADGHDAVAGGAGVRVDVWLRLREAIHRTPYLFLDRAFESVTSASRQPRRRRPRPGSDVSRHRIYVGAAPPIPIRARRAVRARIPSTCPRRSLSRRCPQAGGFVTERRVLLFLGEIRSSVL